MKPIGRTFPLFLATWLMSSCAAMFTGTKESILFTSDPSGAKVLANGEELGVTPLPYELGKKVKEVVFVHPNGGERSVGVDWKFQTGFLLMDILFTPGYGLVGMLVDGGTRAWYKHPELIHVDFTRGTVAGGSFKTGAPLVAIVEPSGTVEEASASRE